MKSATMIRPRCIVMAGPNGAGKTTFDREFLSKEARVVHYVNGLRPAGRCVGDL
jgi:predicted ABC-type ATPase